MEKKFKVSCIGLGHRGFCYLERMAEQSEHYEIIAVCDLIKERVSQAQEQFNLKDENCFLDEENFFKEKEAMF